MDKKWYFKSRDEGIFRKLAEGITTRIFVGDNIMLSSAELEPHTEPSIHSHPEEQWGLLLEGECIRIQGGEEVHMKAGDFWCTPGGTPHGVRTLDKKVLILDIFSPPRGAYTEPGEGLAATLHDAG